jgi:hypothetical protein
MLSRTNSKRFSMTQDSVDEYLTNPNIKLTHAEAARLCTITYDRFRDAPDYVREVCERIRARFFSQ